jgi:hypothetical protein
MWAPSFLSVLHDLWRFFWRIDARTSTELAVLNTRAVAIAESAPSSPVITLDTQRQSIVQLNVGTLYTDESIETILIRNQLKAYDEHLVQSGNLNLIEWLLYKIHLQNNSISLLALRMSPLGLWHQTVRGLPDVKVGIQPATSALMEWFDESRESQVGLIERVSPDNTITLRTISSVPSGTYTELTFTEPVWKEFGPVFTRFRS